MPIYKTTSPRVRWVAGKRVVDPNHIALSADEAAYDVAQGNISPLVCSKRAQRRAKRKKGGK